MRTSIPDLGRLIPPALSVLAIGLSVLGQDRPTEIPQTYEFYDALLPARGVGRLEDLRGRPVLVEYWGTA